ncbi:MAG: hypothetical protein JOZ78_00245 [Chroococcidiopsidaceae cyanobacterium CP_BM_ER_R8_30]|nr:hypothetical protein [Chroococcidiopsidaceae cyanobacterium CP_BM_ER_R8_30]
MKPRLFNLITVFLATSGFFASTQVAFGQTLHQQVKQGEVEHFTCVKQAHQLTCQEETSGEQSHATPKQGAITVLQPLSLQEQKLVAKVLIWLSYLLPSSLLLWIFLSNGYSAYRSAVLKRQIEQLEKLWQSGSDNDATTDSGQGTSS